MAANDPEVTIDEEVIGKSQPGERRFEEDELSEQQEFMTREQLEEEWNQLTVEQLKEELVDRGLSTAGRKSDLVARLIAHELEDAHTHEGVDIDNEECDELTHKEHLGEDVSQGGIEHEGEMDEDNGEGVEFVEWNEGEDGDHELGEEDISETTGPELNESHEDEDHKDGEGMDKSGKHNISVDEGDVKAEDREYSVDVSKDREIFTLNWHGKKLTVPFKSEIIKDLDVAKKLQSVVVYPIELADIYLDAFRRHLEKAVEATLRLEEMKPGNPSKGLLRLKFASLGEALDAIEELKSAKEGVTAKHFCPEDSEGVILSQLHRDDCDRRGSSVFRLLYVGNLPSHVTESSIKETFPDALQVILPYDEETMERTGYAYLEYKNEDDALEASEKYKDVEMEGEKLYVIKAVSVNKDKFGLIRDSLRLYWLDQIRKFRRIVERPHGRGSWEITDAEKKISSLKNLLEKDRRRREELHLPVIDSGDKKKEEEKSDEKERETEGKQSREKRRSSHHSLRDSDQKTGSRRPPPRRSPFPRRDNFRSGRGGRTPGYAPRSEEVANKLVNQLQGLVSALTNKLPDAGSSTHSHPAPRRQFPEEPRYSTGQSRPNYSRPSGYYDGHRSGVNYHSGYTAASYEQSYPSSFRGGYRDNPTDRYSAKRYRDEDVFSPDRKKRISAVSTGRGGYGDQSSSNRYTSSRTPYAMSTSRRGGGVSSLSAGRPYARPKTRGSYNY